MGTLLLVALLAFQIFSNSLCSSDRNETEDYIHILNLGLKNCIRLDFCTVKNENTPWRASCCDRCYCDPMCYINKNCCPDAPSPPPDLDHRSSPEAECRSVFLKNEGYQSLRPKQKAIRFRIVSRCPNGTSCLPIYDSENITEMTEDALTIVLDETTNTPYANRICAECNGATVSSKFTFMISRCEEYLSVDSVTHKNFLQNIYQKCTILSKPSKYQERLLARCYDNIVDRCNVTGTWWPYNPLLEQACLDPNSNFYTYHPRAVYKNTFCMLCNLGEEYTIMFCPVLDVFAPFSDVFKVRQGVDDRQTLSTESRCMESEIFDHVWQNCRRVYCPPLTASSDGDCTPLPVEVKLTQVTLYLRLYPENPDEYIQTIDEGSGYKLSNSDALFEDIGFQLDINYCTLNLRQVYLFDAAMESIFHQSNHMSLYLFYVIDLHPEGNCSYETIARCRDKLVEAPLRTIVAINDISYRFYVTFFEPPVAESTDVSSEFFIQPGDLNYMVASYDKHTITQRISRFSFSVIMNGPFMCPYIILNHSEFCNPASGARSRTCDFPDFTDDFAIPKLTFSDDFKTNLTYNYYYKICLDDYWSIVGHPSEILAKDGPIPQTSGIVSLTLTSASLVSIVVSLSLTSKKQVRSLNSRLITIASHVSLFAALASFQFLSGWTKEPTLCTVSGIMVHYFWLAYVFVSGSYFFTIDTNLQNITPIQRYTKHVVFAVLLSFLAPGIFIMANILYTRATSDDSEIGYDASFGTCLISTSLMRALLFVVPILATALVNIVIFVHIVIRIRRISSDIYINTGSKYYATYVRLLILIGLAWFVGIINEFVRSPVLDYIFIVLACSQGVLSLLSVLSIQYKRKLSTCLTSWRRTSTSQTGSSSKF